jgi:hypothetical protein
VHRIFRANTDILFLVSKLDSSYNKQLACYEIHETGQFSLLPQKTLENPWPLPFNVFNGVKYVHNMYKSRSDFFYEFL